MARVRARVCIAYDSRCITQVGDPKPAWGPPYRDALALGMWWRVPASAFHLRCNLERFG